MIPRAYYFSIILFVLFGACTLKTNEKSIFIPNNIVIAHRGTTWWAPEETESAYRWARDIGAHYLEVDIQRSKDGVLIALHDNKLIRTTNISQVYPDSDTFPSSHFTYEELLKLDAGSWFNKANPERAKKEFSNQGELIKTDQKAFYFDNSGKHVEVDLEEVFFGGMQQILALEDVIRIAEGYRIVKDAQGNRLYNKYIDENGDVQYIFYYIMDPSDSGNRPGVYIETKEPHLFSGIEKDLFIELDELNWNQLTLPAASNQIMKEGKVNIANTSAKIILQTFSPYSLKQLFEYFKSEIPVTFLLWLGDPNMMSDDSLTYNRNLVFAKKYGAQIIGPSIGGLPNDYSDLLQEKHYNWIKNQGLLIHPYSFDTEIQMQKYGEFSDGMFTNRADLTKRYYSDK